MFLGFTFTIYLLTYSSNNIPENLLGNKCKSLIITIQEKSGTKGIGFQKY